MNPNGNPKLLWWITGAILGPVVLAAFNHLMVTTYATSQKASALESEFRAVNQRLDRIERKLDHLVERKQP
jgi:hypothetical protein